jgi:hypothetical protein
MGARLTRRNWAMAAVAATAVPAKAQTTQSAQESPAQLLEAARKQVARNREILDQFKLDRRVEPAFQFKA